MTASSSQSSSGDNESKNPSSIIQKIPETATTAATKIVSATGGTLQYFTSRLSEVFVMCEITAVMQLSY